MQKLEPDIEESLVVALLDPIIPTLHEEILSDAQTASFEGNIRRAVLELAITCEIVAKQKYFSEESASGAAFNHLDDRRVRVVDLIADKALEAFGKSFRIEQNGHYWNIDHLFRCRNNVAHRGELSYKNDGGKSIDVNTKTVSIWWNSVLVLVEWIGNLERE